MSSHSSAGKSASSLEAHKLINPRQPIVLLADSQLLFARYCGRPWLRKIRELLTTAAPCAAYVGASNSDAPEFFELFKSAMAAVGIVNCKMVRKSLSGEDVTLLEGADLILLAGGDESRGWEAIKGPPLADAIVQRYHAGALLIGVSAGAVQMGAYGDLNRETQSERLGLVPLIVDVHEEHSNWTRLKSAVRNLGITGLGIPSGGGAFYTARCEIRHVVTEITFSDRIMRENALFPPV